MKIYFDGGSNTYGGGKLLNHPDRESLRYTAKVSAQLNVEEYNFSIGGASNIRILRQLNDNIDILKECDAVVIEMTMPSRTEYYNVHKDKWQGIQFNSVQNKITIKDKEGFNKEFWETYYREVYHELYGERYENMVYNSIKCICKAYDKPLVLMTSNINSKLKFDLIVDNKYSFDGTAHPSILGHSLIAKKIIKLLKDYENLF